MSESPTRGPTRDRIGAAAGGEAIVAERTGTPPARPEAGEGTRPATVYTCPMHPQIRQAGPGNCPICGMALEPEMPTLEEEKNPELEDFSRRFWWTLPLSAISVILAMGGHRLLPFAGSVMAWIELAIATPVVV